MPAARSEQLTQAIADAILQSGYAATLVSPPRRQPRRYLVAGPSDLVAVYVYAWTLTPGGRPQLANEFRIQMTSVQSPLQSFDDGPTILLGFEPSLGLFAGFDVARHRTFTPGSSSVQIDRVALRAAEDSGLSFHRKTNSEIAVGIRPDMLMAYAMNAGALHRLGGDAKLLRALEQSAREPAPPVGPPPPASDRRRLVSEVARLSRDAAFRRRVTFAYGNRCAVTRVQLRLVDAAHILPVGAPGSSDHVQNGIALSPTYHRAFDAGLIYLTEEFEMRISEASVATLRGLGLAGGVEAFRAPLGPIFLPPDPAQRPAPDFIRRANRVRQIGA